MDTDTIVGADTDQVETGLVLAKVQLHHISIHIGIVNNLTESVSHSDVVHALSFDCHSVVCRVRVDSVDDVDIGNLGNGNRSALLAGHSPEGHIGFTTVDDSHAVFVFTFTSFCVSVTGNTRLEHLNKFAVTEEGCTEDFSSSDTTSDATAAAATAAAGLFFDVGADHEGS